MIDRKTRIISIVSGKGGAGKTLIAATLGRALAHEIKDEKNKEKYRILLIDLDIFVRGLSVFFFTQLEPQSTQFTSVIDLLRIVSDNRKIIGHYDYQKVQNFSNEYFSQIVPAHSSVLKCDILPATHTYSEIINYDSVLFTQVEYNKFFLISLLEHMRGKYDLIFLDCRAGNDSQILAAASVADHIIGISDDDDTSFYSNITLSKMIIEYTGKSTYSIINKGRRKDVFDLKLLKKVFGIYTNALGTIPFDMEIIQDFGKRRNWKTIDESLFLHSLIDIWNKFAEGNNLPRITKNNYYFPPESFMSETAGFYPYEERVLKRYGSIISFAGLFFILYSHLAMQGSPHLSAFDILSYFAVVFGIISLLIATPKFRQWILREKDKLPESPL